MSGEKYVVTDDVKSALSGREHDVLSSLGIDWTGGSGHIDCPYPGHGGVGDWRWDEHKARAYCTCIDGSDGILDVIRKCESVELDEAKIRAAEMLGRSDLIKTKGGARKGEHDNQFQSTKPHRLLNASGEFVENGLVAAYLSHRLGMDEADVLLPSTRIKGFSKLPYWEGRAGGKPKTIGSFACAVFEQKNAEGQIHAHRIYVAPNGRGKADLGKTSRGTPRNVKVSATKENKEENVSGRSVLWGDPTKAPHIIVTEGIETGAAVAHAFRQEIEANEIVVAAAISAVGVEAFKPWPATRRVTIAADRDDAEKRGKPGSQRGDKAARTFALRHLGKIKTAIALPGSPGQSLDWLDVLLADGVDAVRSGISGAAAFQATKEELEEKRRFVDREAEIAEISQAYPLPVLNNKQLVYAHDDTDRVRLHKVERVKDPITKQEVDRLTPIMTPMGIAARLRNVDQENAYSLRIVVQDMNGRPRNIDVARKDLAKMNGVEIRSMLLENGLRVEDDGEAVAVAMLKAADPDDEIVIVRHPAWHQLGDDDGVFFVAPGGQPIGAPGDRAVELHAGSRLAPAIVSGGSLEGWKTAVRAALSQVECPHWALGVMAGFAGPLIALTGMDTCGINLSGRSSSGKTTAQKLAVSAWTVPDTTRKGLFQSARSTANGMEAFCQQANGTILSLDELAHVPGKEMAKAIYTIAGGVGKTRMKADATLRESARWSTFAVLSAESSLQEKIESDGETFMAGMAVRIPDIDVSGIDRNVDKAIMRQIEDVSRHFGHAGPAFVEGLVREGLHRKAAELRETINKTAMVLAGGEKADSALIRAALPFAVLMTAGGQAQRVGLLPKDFEVHHSISWAWGRFNLSSDAAVLNPQEQALANLRLWINERWGVTIRDVYHTTGNQPAVAWYDADAVYIPKDRLREAAGDALKQQEIVAALEAGGYLAKRKGPKRPYVEYIPSIGPVTAYALRRPAFGRSGTSHDPEAYRLIEGGRPGD